MWEGMWREQAGKGSGIRRCGRGLCSGPEEGGMVSLWIFGYTIGGLRIMALRIWKGRREERCAEWDMGLGFWGFCREQEEDEQHLCI